MFRQAFGQEALLRAHTLALHVLVLGLQVTHVSRYLLVICLAVGLAFCFFSCLDFLIVFSSCNLFVHMFSIIM